MSFFEDVVKAEKEGKLYCLATVISTKGNVPQKAGSKMLVLGNGETSGTVGGGVVEKAVVADCLKLMETGGTLTGTYSHYEGQDEELIEANNMTIFMECSEAAPHLYLLGAGHVAQSILKLAKSIGYYVVVFDTRDVSAFMEDLKNADQIIRPEKFADLRDYGFAKDSAIIVTTYNHENDMEALEAVMRADYKYLGMLGGKPKIKGIMNNLRKMGYTEEEIGRVHAPIGLDIGGSKPTEIAVSVVAEIMAVMNERTGKSMKELIAEEK